MPFGPIPGSLVFPVAIGMLDRIWLPRFRAAAAGVRDPETNTVEAGAP